MGVPLREIDRAAGMGVGGGITNSRKGCGLCGPGGMWVQR